MLGTLMKICREIPNLAEIDQNIGPFTWQPKCVLLLPATFNRHKSAVLE
jgi:hypothetical protein